jgi:hypothetical protein
MAKAFQSLKETIRNKLTGSAREQNSSRKTSAVRPTEKEAEEAPPERVGEIVGHSSSG